MSVKKDNEPEQESTVETVGTVADQEKGTDTPRTLKFGMQGAEVKTLQQQLAAKGFTVTASGTFDMDTVKAVRLAQHAKRLPETGIVRAGALADLIR